MTLSSKQKKIALIIIIVLASLVVLGGLGTGIYFGVTTIPTSGIVVEEGTNTPVANVSVTNGRHVVKTDKDGKFELKGWHKARFVAITNPSGYWTEDYYKEISRKTKEYKFTLEKLETDQTNHTFLQVTDTEINENGVGEWFEHIDKLVKETNPAFIIHTGDICYEAGLKQHIKDLNSETFGVPVRYTIGNHDFVDGKYGERLFEDVYGPVNYSFDVGDIHYIVSSLAYGDRLPKYTAGDVIKWMKADLENVADGKKVVIFNHDVCSDETGFVMKSGATKLDLKKEDVIAWINGHLHYSFVNDYNGILNISTPALIGGIDGSIGGVRIIDVESNKIANIEMSYTDYDPQPSDEGYEWQTQLTGNNLYADPVLVGDKLYVATMDNNYPRKPVVACIDINAENEEDRIIWTFNPKNSVKNNFYMNNGVVVVQDAEGYVYGLDANDGKKKWEKDLGLITYRYAMNGIVGEGDKVYCGNQRKVVCFNIKTGSEIWKYETNTGEASAFKMQILDNKLIMGSNWKYLFALNKDNGKLLWQSKDWIYTQQSAFMYKGNIYSLDSSNVWKYNPQKGTSEIVKTFTKKVDGKDVDLYNFNVASKPYIEGNIAYVATAKNGVIAINMDTFKVVWECVTEANMIYSSPYSGAGAKGVDAQIVSKGNYIYFGALDGNLYVVDKKTGDKVDIFNIGAPILSKAILGDSNGQDFIIVSDFAGKVTKINLTSDGKFDRKLVNV